MSHELAFFTDGRARLAYVGSVPWHGLGQALTPNAPIEVWAKEAGMDFEIKGSPVAYKTESGKTFAFGKKQVLYRADTEEALSVVGEKYKVVQPMEVLEFFRNLVADQGFALETAGVLFGGAKYFAMARTGNEIMLSDNDKVRQYLLLMTSCDGTLRTTAKMVDTRVVCNNTIQMATHEKGGAQVKISHTSAFDAGKLQVDLQVFDELWAARAVQIELLAKTKVTAQQAVQFVINLVGDATRTLEENKSISAVGKVLSLYDGFGKGSELGSAKETAWGLVNSISEYQDWHVGKSQDHRLASAYAYGGSQLKMQAFDAALALTA